MFLKHNIGLVISIFVLQLEPFKLCLNTELMNLPFDPGGLIWVVQWNSLLHPIASAFLAVLYSDYMLTSQTEMLYCNEKSYKPEDLRKFAISQVYNLLPPHVQLFCMFLGCWSR